MLLFKESIERHLRGKWRYLLRDWTKSAEGEVEGEAYKKVAAVKKVWNKTNETCLGNLPYHPPSATRCDASGLRGFVNLTELWIYIFNWTMTTQTDNLHEDCHHMTRLAARTPPYPRETRDACVGNMSTSLPIGRYHHHGYLVTTTWQFCLYWPTESSVHCPVHTLNGLAHCDLRNDKLWECWLYWGINYTRVIRQSRCILKGPIPIILLQVCYQYWVNFDSSFLDGVRR